jgi:hypothetical protein
MEKKIATTYLTANGCKKDFTTFRSSAHRPRLGLSLAGHNRAFCIDVLFHADIGILIQWYGYGVIAQWTF